MPFDSTQLLDASPHEATLIEGRKALARAEREPEAKAAREIWLKERREEIAAAGGDVSADAIAAVLDTKVLPGAWVLHVESIERRGTFDPVPVAQVLRDPVRYHGRRARDPADPGYQNGASVAVLRLRGKVKRITSYASGGTDYVLETQHPTVLLKAGEMHAAVDTILDHVRVGTDLFDYGTQLVRVEDGRMEELNDLTFGDFIARGMRFVKLEVKRGKVTESRVDPPPRLLQTIIARQRTRHLKPLETVATIPFIRLLDCSVVQTPGYDKETGIYLDLKGKEVPRISERPSPVEARAALRLIEDLLKDFVFASPRDRSAALTALLTAALRPGLDLAPIIAVQGHSIGSAKTAMATGFGALTLGRLPGPEDATILLDVPETRKTITGHLRKSNAGVIFFDNADGAQASSPLATLLTSPYWSARLLGLTHIEAELPTRTLVLLTGTGLLFQGDLTRRAILCRLEPRPVGAAPVENFADVILRKRLSIVAAALTLVRAALTSGAPKAPGEVMSFPKWDRYVRQTVAWIGTHLEPGTHEDPRAILNDEMANATDRVELFDVLRTLQEIFEDREFDAADIAEGMAAVLPAGFTLRQRAVLKGLFKDSERPSAKSVGRYLAPKAGCQVEGLRLVAHRGRGMLHFQIEGEVQ